MQVLHDIWEDHHLIRITIQNKPNETSFVSNSSVAFIMSWYFSSCKQRGKKQNKIRVTVSQHKKVALVLYTLLFLLCLPH